MSYFLKSSLFIILNELTNVNELYVKIKYYPQCNVHDLPLRCAAVPCVRVWDWVIVIASQRKPAVSLYQYIFIYSSQLDLLIDAETLYTRLLLCLQLVCYDGMLICMEQQQPPYAHFCPTWSPFLYFKWQRCRTSLLIFSFFILSPSLLCVCISFPTSRCLYYVFWNYFLFCIHIRRMDSTPFQHVST